jgi:hypothetical protein
MQAAPTLSFQPDEATTMSGGTLMPDSRGPSIPDGEGGLIELESPDSREPRLEPSVEPHKRAPSKRLRGDEGTAVLDWLWSQWDKFADLALDPPAVDADAAPLERRSADPRPVDQARTAKSPTTAFDAEGGLIELVAGDTAFDRPNRAYAAADGADQPDSGVTDSAVAMEAGVALFRAFELGTAPPAAQSAAEPSPTELPPAEAKATTDEASSNHKAAAITGAGLLLALPFSTRRARRHEQWKASRRS